MSKYLIPLLLFFSKHIIGQEETSKTKVYQTFKDTRLVNGHSVETLKAGVFDLRIAHRFGDIGGAGGGWQTFWGLEQAADVMIGFDIGLTNNMMIGLNRTKGSGPLRQNINLYSKIKISNQEKKGQPFSMALFSQLTMSTMSKSSIEAELNYFEKFGHRFSYHLEFLLARKSSQRFSYQISGALTYRNIVPNGDANELASIGIGSRIQMSKSLAILVDARIVFSDIRTTDNGYHFPLGLALEWETGGGHVFQINFTNAKGISSTDYIPYTQSNWLDGELRLGFTISRHFRL